VTRGVDQVELVRAAVARVVVHSNGVELDRDAALALEVERVEHLVLHLALLEGSGGFDEPVRQRRFPMIDVGDDAEVADMVQLQSRLEIVKVVVAAKYSRVRDLTARKETAANGSSRPSSLRRYTLKDLFSRAVPMVLAQG
jgi:hypothetical protein